MTGSVECALHWHFQSRISQHKRQMSSGTRLVCNLPNYSKMADLPARGELFHLQIILAGKMLLLRTLTDALSVWV